MSAAAFLSYTRSDDEYHDGAITSIRKKIAGEVSVQTGEPFEIFQDRKDISWGQQWQERIDSTLDSVTFLIPIITPSFFKSKPCREESSRFLAREKKLQRNDLVLPIYYIDCPFLKDRELQRDDEIAEILIHRQYVDWREHRFSNIDAAPVKKLIAEMATQIRDAIGRPQLNTVVPESEESQPALEDSTNNRFADDRLNQQINFGSTLEEIAVGFKKEMDNFNEIDGSGPDKFLALGAHVYKCVAASIDRSLYELQIAPEQKSIFQQISQNLKRLANYDQNITANFFEYWKQGTELSNRLLDQVHHVQHLTT